MWRRKRITQHEATAAKAKLQQFCERVDRLRQLDDALQVNPYAFGSESRERAKARAQAAAEKGPLSDALLQQSHEIAKLVRDVHVDGYLERAPRHGRSAVQQAIGLYEGIEAGKPPPEPPATPAQSTEGDASTRSWWASPVALAVIALISGAVGGVGASLVVAFYGTRQTCVAGDEKACEPRNGVPYVRVCRGDGLAYDPCKPLSDGVPAAFSGAAPNAPRD